MEAVSSELTFFTLPNCFELFGFDLLVDQDWNVWLLEVSQLKATLGPETRHTRLLIRGVGVVWKHKDAECC